MSDWDRRNVYVKGTGRVDGAAAGAEWRHEGKVMEALKEFLDKNCSNKMKAIVFSPMH